MATLSPTIRRALVRACQIALTFGVFAFFNAVAFHFEIENGVSILFPATAISIIACMWLGVWGAIGVVLGTIVTPWGPVTHTQLVLSGLLSAVEGLIPYFVFRFRRELTGDLRDMKSLIVFLIFGTVVNSAVSAILGNLFVVEHPPGVTLVWRQVFVWWIADFTAALLIATPVLSFGGTLFRRARTADDRPRTIGNALQIVTVVILLGFAASFAIRNYLLNRLEQERLDQQQAWLGAQETLNRLHTNFLRAAFLDANDRAAAIKLDAARQTNEEFFRAIELASAGASDELARELPQVRAATTRWFENPSAEGTSAHATGRRILGLRGMMDRANARAWQRFTGTRRKIMLVAALVDAIVFSILVLATTTLLYTISRPFAQLRAGIHRIRKGQPFDASRIDSRYLEFRSIAETLEETASELRSREEELRLQTEKAIKASQHKSEFLAKMSHELRTPLNSIIGFSDLMTEQEATMSSQKRLAFLDNVATSARHLLKLINDLLDIAKVESGKMNLHLENVDLRLSITSTVASTQPLFVRKKQEVEVRTPDSPMLARADAGRIEQVLLNLLSNANKFTPEGETIVVSGGAEASMWRIEVADRGIGISTADQRRIFDEFEQVDAPTTHSTGTGLGLALAKKFVEAHGGTIEVDSVLGAGARFSVRLPRA
jgi:signal transduction histidine kinase/integral membrane sensor domain MASE1